MFFKYIRVFFYCYEDIKRASFYEEQFTPYKNQGKGGGGIFKLILIHLIAIQRSLKRNCMKKEEKIQRNS